VPLFFLRDLLPPRENDLGVLNNIDFRSAALILLPGISLKNESIVSPNKSLNF